MNEIIAALEEYIYQNEHLACPEIPRIEKQVELARTLLAILQYKR